jgi:hypothetical protein
VVEAPVEPRRRFGTIFRILVPCLSPVLIIKLGQHGGAIVYTAMTPNEVSDALVRALKSLCYPQSSRPFTPGFAAGSSFIRRAVKDDGEEIHFQLDWIRLQLLGDAGISFRSFLLLPFYDRLKNRSKVGINRVSAVIELMFGPSILNGRDIRFNRLNYCWGNSNWDRLNLGFIRVIF